MKIIEINPSLFSEPNQAFKNRFNYDLDVCELSEENKRGLLFLLGAYLPGMLTDNFGNDEKAFFENIPVLGLYSKSTYQFSDYGELNDGVFNYWIYNTCTLLAQISDPNASIDENLRKIDQTEIIIWKTEFNVEFLNKNKNEKFSLNLIQNINDQFFYGIGKELLIKEFSLERSYEAGIAYRMMMMQMDLKGTQFLINMLGRALSPLYSTFLYMPTLFFTNQYAFERNHLFSRVLNTFVGSSNDSNSSLMKIYKPIHSYHQFLFYKEGTSDLKEEWNFERHDENGSGINIFLNAIRIRNTGLLEANIQNFDMSEIYDKSIIHCSITKNELLKKVLLLVNEKYGIDGFFEFTNESQEWNDGLWNNKGEYIQFLVILYYETCLHSMVVNELN